jgi:hypothetical protein
MRRYLLLALAFVVVAILSVVLIPRGEDARIITLPDGKRVEFLGTTIGNQTFTTEKSWHKTARRILPSRFQSWLPAVSSASCSSGTNSITVFFQVTDPSGAPIAGTPWQSYRAEDDEGFLYNPGGSYCAFGGGLSSQIYGLSLTAHPRRDPSFRFQFIGAADAVIGTLRIPNPVPGPFAQWTPLPLPQSATNGPVILTLEGLQHYDSKRWQSVGPKWKTDSTAPHWKRAKLRSSTLLDATGNDAQWLSPREPAWKLRTVIHRDRDDDFQSEERWLLSDIPAPATNQFTAVDQSTNVLGVTIAALLISSPGKLHITNGTFRGLDVTKPFSGGDLFSWDAKSRVESWGGDKPFLLLETRNQSDGDEIRINVFDDRGIKLNTAANHTENRGSSNGKWTYTTRFEIPSDAKTLSLEVIVSRPLVFEFMVNPKDVQAAKPPFGK